MKLSTLLSSSGVPWNNPEDVTVDGLSYDSRQVKKGDLFFAVPGTRVDGHNFLGDALKMGACAAIVEKKVNLMEISQIKVDSVIEKMADISHHFFNQPSQNISVLGITGTNGKTTVTYLIERLFQLAGKKCGVMGTVNYRIGSDSNPAPNTTPMSIDVQRFLSKNISAGSDAVVMEVSSHALELHRVDHVKFSIGIFTNLTQDHLDFHKDMESYFQAKNKLFKDPRTQAVVNMDDPYGQKILEKRPAGISFGTHKKAKLRAENCILSLDGNRFDMVFPSGRSYSISNNLMGNHNISNCLAAAGGVLAFGLSENEIVHGLNQDFHVPGRLERVPNEKGLVVLVDYAHTHAALEQALKALKETNPQRLICLFGAGGDRDRTKRPKMGEVAIRYSDFVYVTSDNPRTEDPKIILEDIQEGIAKTGKSHYKIISDRKEAITEMINHAKTGDILLIAGKGHEEYQIIGNKKVHFSDQEHAQETLSQ